MTSLPAVNIDLQGIRANAARMKEICDAGDISLTGVVKGAAGDVRAAEAFLEGGIESLGDSRLRNLKIFQEAGLGAEYMLLRLPDPHEAEQVVELADISLNSELTALQALARAARKKSDEHKVVIMIDVGDLREGLWEDEIEDFFSRAQKLEGINIAGLGTNVGCYGGVLPTYDNTRRLIEIRERISADFGLKLPLISGGNTATTLLLQKGEMPPAVNHLRVGEGILQGTDVTHQRQLEEFNNQNITLSARIIELKQKPSVPLGPTGHDAFGGKPEFEDRGIRKRAILAVGRQDIRIAGLNPIRPGAEIIGASSDHLLVDVTAVADDLTAGDRLEFELSYGAMLAAMTSPYVSKNYLDE